jgi:hypothetical protein
MMLGVGDSETLCDIRSALLWGYNILMTMAPNLFPRLAIFDYSNWGCVVS